MQHGTHTGALYDNLGANYARPHQGRTIHQLKSMGYSATRAVTG